MYANSPFQVPMTTSLPIFAPSYDNFPRVEFQSVHVPTTHIGTSNLHYDQRSLNPRVTQRRVNQMHRVSSTNKLSQIPLAPCADYTPVQAVTTIYLPRLCCNHCPYRSNNVINSVKSQNQSPVRFTSYQAPSAQPHNFSKMNAYYSATTSPNQARNSLKRADSKGMLNLNTHYTENDNSFREFQPLSFKKKPLGKWNYNILNRARTQPRLEDRKDFIPDQSNKSLLQRMAQQSISYKNSRRTQEQLKSKQLYKYFIEMMNQQQKEKHSSKLHSRKPSDELHSRKPSDELHSRKPSDEVGIGSPKALNRKMKTQLCQVCDKKLTRNQTQSPSIYKRRFQTEDVQLQGQQNQMKNAFQQELKLLRLRVKQQVKNRMQKAVQVENLKSAHFIRNSDQSNDSNGINQNNLVQSQYRQQYTPVQHIFQDIGKQKNTKDFDVINKFDFSKKKKMLKKFQQANNQYIYSQIHDIRPQKQHKYYKNTEILTGIRIQDKIHKLRTQNQKLWNSIRH